MVMAKLDDARVATTAKTTPGHEPKKQGVFVEAHQRWSTGRFAGSGVFLELDQRRSSWSLAGSSNLGNGNGDDGFLQELGDIVRCVS